jgi:short subunit dehydrogenase-like uncharacterized protein
MGECAVVVYGASGFTGRLICKELARRGIAFSIAGRDVHKLNALAQTLVPEGPSDKERAHARFAVWAQARGRNGTRAVWVTGGDTYDLTAAAATLCATWASRVDFAARGALSPAQAFGARKLLDGLADSGVAWGTSPIVITRR